MQIRFLVGKNFPLKLFGTLIFKQRKKEVLISLLSSETKENREKRRQAA